MYADDTQIYIGFDVATLSATAAKSRLETCIVDISKWISENKLQLNEDKKELVVINPSQQAGKVYLNQFKWEAMISNIQVLHIISELRLTNI